MKRAIGRTFVAALLLAAGCGSDNNNATGGGGHGGTGAGGTGTAGTTGGGGTGGHAGSGAAGTGAAGTGAAGTGAAGTGAAGTGVAGNGVAGTAGGGTSGGGSGGGGASGGGTSGGGTGGGTGGSAWLDLPVVPPALAVPAGATLKIHDHATGSQIYTCMASGGADAGADGGATTYAWVLKAPDAKLYDSANVQVGTHGAGPNWTSIVDASIVNGAKVAQVDSTVATAIPWLLLRATSNTGTGVFSDITYVQRVNTAGGKAPATGCDSTTVDTDMSVAYTADYYFYTGGGSVTDWLTPPANLPAIINVPAGATIKIHDHAIGAQVYTCTATVGGDGGATTYAWVLKAPDAILYDRTFVQVGTHGMGPNWTSTDGSIVNGTKLQQANSPTAGNIPWLLLQASSTSGTGVFTDITYVQRLNTAGGPAPASGCDSTTVNTDTRVNYSADYYFFTGGNTDGSTNG